MNNSSSSGATFKEPAAPEDMSVWIHSMFVVTFDIEFGQAIEAQLPKGVSELALTETERNNICYSSFPDSNSSILGSTQFHFRMRLSKLDQRLKQFYSFYNTNTTLALNVDTQFVYGYVHFLQRKDSSLKRGYFQKSLVILSLLPFTELFYHIVNVVGSNYFENEHLLSLDNVYNQIRRWPEVRTGEVLNLIILGSSIAFYIPNKDDKLNNLHANLSPTSSLGNSLKLMRTRFNEIHRSSNNYHIDNGLSMFSPVNKFSATSVHGTPLTLTSRIENYHTILTAFDLDLYSCFQSMISDLQMLWEMVLTCEPFIVIAPKPDLCANFVQALISLIYPFRYNADHRPFFTIHDPEFREYVGQKDTKPNVILGVTNPFFAKSLDHWPNVIQICSMTSSKSSDQISSLISTFSSMNYNQQPTSFNNMNQQFQAPQQHSRIPFVDRLRFSAPDTLKPGLNTKYRAYLSKDRNFLTKILRSNKTHGHNRPNNVQTALIRRWLIELTQSFFMPLERYLTQLMPLHNKISAFKAPPQLPTFDFDAFASTLDSSGPQLTTKIKGDWPGLYKKFFQGANFRSWYGERKSEIDRKLWSLHMESFLDIDLPKEIGSKDEVEMVDMIIRVRNRLAQAVKKSHEYQFTCSNLEQFKFKLNELINALPTDLRPLFSQWPDWNN